jgi:hypothetical protein
MLIAAIVGFRTPAASAATSSFANPASQLSTAAPTQAITTSTITDKTSDATRAITWANLVNFLAKDHTNWNAYIPGKYTCLDFSTDLVANAKQQEIKAWIVAVDFTAPGPGHAFVAFSTSDHGVVYVEPQADDTYSIVAVGKNLCDSWGVYQCMGMVSSIQFLQCDKAHYCTKYTP